MTRQELLTYILTYIRNSSVESFTNYRLQTVLLELLGDSASSSLGDAANTTILQALSGSTYQYVIVTGSGIYEYSSTGTPNGTTIFAATGGGTWNLIFAAGTGGSTAWNDITGKPSTFPPTVPIAATDVTEDSNNRFVSDAEKTTWNAKQAALSLTTTGSSGAATLIGATLNIPQYSGGSAYSQEIAFTSAIPFTFPLTLMNEEVSGAIAFTHNTTDQVAGSCTVVRLVADGTNVPTFNAVFKKLSTSDDYDNAVGTVHQIVFFWHGEDFNPTYSIAISEVIDIANPTFVSASVEEANPNQIVLIYNESLDEASVPAPGDFAATASVSGAKTPTAVDVTGTTVTVTYDENFDPTDVITTDYTPGTNKIQDPSGNLASALSGQSVTNNISTEVAFAKGYGLTDGDIVASGNGWEKTAADGTYDIISSTTQSITPGGYFYLHMSNLASRVMFGFIDGTNNTPTAAVNQFLHGLMLWSGVGVVTYENGSYSGAVYDTVSNGDWFRVWYENSTTVKFQKSTNSGASWSTVRTSSLNPASASYKPAILMEIQNEEVLSTKLKLS